MFLSGAFCLAKFVERWSWNLHGPRVALFDQREHRRLRNCTPWRKKQFVSAPRWWLQSSLSVIVPTYNRLRELKTCLDCLEDQTDPGTDYEVLVIDDGSTDGTTDWLERAQRVEMLYPHVRLLRQEHNGGPARARNRGVDVASGDVLVFVDSDIMVSNGFLRAHWLAHAEARGTPIIAVGPVLHVHSLDAKERRLRFHPLFDASRAFFCTSNASVSGSFFRQCGCFDEDFCLYGWEDLECGERLRLAGQGQLRHIRLPWSADGALAFHYKPPFDLNQIPRLVQQEQERGTMGYLFYRKMPTWSVRMMIQYTWFHRMLWFVLTWAGFWNVERIRPLLAILIAMRQPDVALFIFTIVLNRITCEAVFRAAAHHRTQDPALLAISPNRFKVPPSEHPQSAAE